MVTENYIFFLHLFGDIIHSQAKHLTSYRIQTDEEARDFFE